MSCSAPSAASAGCSGNNAAAVPGWEALYADGRFTIHVFRMLLGVATGIIVGDVGTVLFTQSGSRELQPSASTQPGATKQHRSPNVPQEHEESGVTVPVSGPGQIPAVDTADRVPRAQQA